MSSNRRLLSSRATLIYKLGSPGLIAIVWLAGSTAVMLEANGLGPERFAFPLLGIVLFGIVYLVVGRAKHVVLEGDILLVTGLRRSVSIPLADIEAVGGSRFTNPERIWLHLRRPSEFGNTIHFLPPHRWFRLFSRHPLVDELNGLVAESSTGVRGQSL